MIDNDIDINIDKMSIVGVNGNNVGDTSTTLIIGRDTNVRDALEARRVSTGPMALAGKNLKLKSVDN